MVLRRALGDGPRLQGSIDSQTEVVVKTGGPMFLHDECIAVLLPRVNLKVWELWLGQTSLPAFSRRWLTRRLRSFIEASFSLVFFELGHRCILLQGPWLAACLSGTFDEDSPCIRPICRLTLLL